MVEFLLSISIALKYFLIITFILALIGFAILFYDKWKDEVPLKLKIMAYIFFFSVFLNGFLLLIISASIEKSLRGKLTSFINKNYNDIIVLVNNKQIDDKSRYLNILSKIHTVPAHHSSTSDTIKIDLNTKSDTIKLLLLRDTEYKDDFWVYDLKYQNLNEIGHVNIDVK